MEGKRKMKVKLLTLIYCFLFFEGYTQEVKSDGLTFFQDFDIFSLEGASVLKESQAIKSRKYVKVQTKSGSTIVSIIDPRFKTGRQLDFDSGRHILEGRNFLMHRIPKSGTGSNEKVKIVGKDSLLILQSVGVAQGVFPSIIYKSNDTINIERWRVMKDYDSLSLEYLVSNSCRIINEKFFKEGEKWVNEYFVLKTGFLSRRKLKSKQLRYIDILAWCESKDCQIR
ncbi:MAG: hypothetical protein WBP58_08255 [Chitinophagaceae bacterium]